MTQELSELELMLVSHSFVTGQPQLLERFLRKNVGVLAVTYHPLPFCEDLTTRSYLYECGRPIHEAEFPTVKLPEVLLYARHFFLTLYSSLRLKRRFDLYVGADSLNAFAGLFLRKMGLVKKVVIYSIDLPIIRFSNSFENRVYHLLNQICAYYCDFIWDLSERMQKVREIYGAKEEKCAPRIIVPASIDLKSIRRNPLEIVDQKTLVFLGHLKESQGVQLVIASLPTILQEIPDAKVTIIGTGPFERELKQMVKKMCLDESVSFLGYIEDHRLVEDIVSKCGVGVAPYVPDAMGITRFADPMKPKVYMACGLPVIITDVPSIATEIRRRAGVVIKYDKAEFVKAAKKLMADKEFYEKCRRNALELAANYDTDEIFKNAIFSSLK